MVFGLFRKRVKPPVGLFDEKQKESESKKSRPDIKESGRKKSGSDINELLKIVTQQKKNDLPLAISTLKGVFELDKKEKVLTLKQHLRLYPLLQKNGQKEEAFQEFSRLFTYGYPRQGNKPIGTTNNLPPSPYGQDDTSPDYVDYVEQFKTMSVMYGEMTKFFITEKNKNEIVPHFILSQLFNLRWDVWVSKLRERIDPKLVELYEEYLKACSEEDGDREDELIDILDNPDWGRKMGFVIQEGEFMYWDRMMRWVRSEDKSIQVVERRTNDDQLVKLLTPILKKSGQLDLIEEIMDIFKKHINVLPAIETQKVFDDLSYLKQ